MKTKAAKVKLTWSRDNASLDFIVEWTNFVIDGFVARQFDSVLYYASSRMTHVTRKGEDETSDCKAWAAEEWLDTEGDCTVFDAIRHNLDKYGIPYEVPKMIEPNEVLENAVKKLIATCVKDFPFEGLKVTKAEKRVIAREFADCYAMEEGVLIDRGWDCPKTGKVGLLNVDWEYIGNLWDEWIEDIKNKGRGSL